MPGACMVQGGSAEASGGHKLQVLVPWHVLAGMPERLSRSCPAATTCGAARLPRHQRCPLPAVTCSGEPAGLASRTLTSCAAALCCVCSPPGTWLPSWDVECQVCPQDTYRTGDATPENNVCKPIPPGATWAVQSRACVFAVCPHVLFTWCAVAAAAGVLR